MPSKLQAYEQMSASVMGRLTGSYKGWTDFLTTSARLYKYPFHEQVMIFAQRPDATACAEYDFWNQRMRRYVRRGSTGIALIDTSGGRPVLRYVFDVSDTGGKDNARRPYLWQYRDEHQEAVSAALENRFGVSGKSDLAEQLEGIAAQLAAEYWNDHKQDILDIVDGSFLEEYDEFNVGAAFRNAASVSIAYTLMSRCGLEPKTYFEHEDFLSIFDFNTTDTIGELGTAVSQGSEQVLRQIEVVIKNYEREKLAERSAEHGEQSDLHQGGRLPDSQSGPERTAAEGAGPLREDAPDVSEGASSGPLQPPDSERPTVQPSVGDRGHGGGAVGADDAGAGESGGGNGGVEGRRSDEVGGADEQLQGPGGGNHSDGADLQLTFFPPAIPSQQEQIQSIQEAESVQTPSASAVSQEGTETPAPPQEAPVHIPGAAVPIPADPAAEINRPPAAEPVEKPVPEPVQNTRELFYAYTDIKQAHPEDIVLFQVGDFYEMFGTDAENAASMLGLALGARPIANMGHATMCAIPANQMDSYVGRLREQYDVTVSGIVQQTGERTTVSFLSLEHERTAREQAAEHTPPPAAAEAAPPKAPVSNGITNMDIEKLLIEDFGITGRKQRIFQLYQQGLSDGEIADHLRSEYNRHGYTAEERAHEGPCVLADGGSGYGYFVAAEWRLCRRDADGPMRHVKYKEMARHIRTLIDEGRYLTPEELAQSVPAPVPEAPVEVSQSEPPAPAPALSPQEAIDAALQEWNGDIASKHTVIRYMRDHARDKDTAAWLRREYGDDLPAFPVPGAGTDLPWPKVQRRIVQLIQKDQFYTQEERDNFDDIDPVAIREALENGESSAFVDQVMADVEQLSGGKAPAPEHVPTVREIFDQYKPVIKNLVLADAAYQNACRNSDKEMAIIEGDAAVKRAALTITEPDFMRLYYDMSDFRYRLHREIIDETYPALSRPQQEVQAPDLSGLPITREGDTITIGDGPAAHEVDITVSDEEWQTIQNVIGAADQPPHDPLAPAYAPGDTVYLNDTAFEITGIGLLDVELRDPALPIPLFRTESKENFERLLHMDPRNDRIVQYLPADMNRVNDDFREVLSSHLLTDRDKGYISGWLRSGENNRGIAQRLSLAFASRAETVTLETGDIADYFASTTSMAVEIQDKFGTKLALSWEAVAPILRAMYQQELDGFTHEPPQREPVTLEGKLSYQVGDRVAFPFGDHEVNGTIGYIGEIDVRIDTGPYAWSHQTVNRDFFEDAVRHDERNAGLFSPEAPAQEVPETTAPGTATLYPGDKNGLPYDIVVETLHFDEPERPQPEQPETLAQAASETAASVPAGENFRITDDHLGEGGPREKYRMNMEAIRTLKQIEAEGRDATSAEQEVLSRYVGWGGVPEAFDPDNAAWSSEYRELKGLLTDQEYELARASTLNAHYTNPTVIRAVYEAVENMGFRKGNILEPSCGVGNFFGLLPESMAASRLYGVELDSITGRIAQQLYPKANIQIQGFEKTDFPDGFFDIAIGNVPFGNYKLVDKRYDRQNLLIHDYFFAKTIDKVRTGGVIAFITSNGISGGTMDKKDSHAREYMAQRCDLLGAVRLPTATFRANAGTDTTMDIVFLQKREVPRTPNEPMPDWVKANVLQEGTFFDRREGRERPNFVTINPYFQQHPEMVLGDLNITTGPFGPQLVCTPREGADLAQQLHEAVSHIQGQITEPELPELGEDELVEADSTIPAIPGIKNFSFAVVDGEVYYRENSIMVKPELNATARERIVGMVELRDCVRRLIDLQMQDADALSIYVEQKKLNQLYDAYTGKFGLINSRGNALAFDSDSSYYLLCSLENLDEDGKLKSKADMFTKRTIQPHRAVTHVDTAVEALAVSIGEKARVDMPYMAQLSGKSEEELAVELRGVIFRVPYGDRDGKPTYQAADEYLSGNIREKLASARRVAEQDPAFSLNVESLEKVMPQELEASEIDVRLGADWIDRKYYQQFMLETFKTPAYLRGKIKLSHSQYTSEWQITGKRQVAPGDVTALWTFGTERANAYDILEDTLNLRDVRVYDTIREVDGRERRVLNRDETTLAQQKQQAMKDAFRDWIWQDPDRREALVGKYNRIFNSNRPREYDGRHIVFAGMNPEITLREHQVNAIAHTLYGGNTLLAHEVGAGKTFEMVASAMEAKRLGLCRKSLFAVPNHLIEQWASEFLRLYPSANVLVATKKDFETRNRKKFCAKIATGDYDAIIMGHSQFERLPVSMQRRERLLQEQITEITEGIQELKAAGAEKFTVKQLERTKKSLTARLEKLQSSPRDDVISFEQLGIDRLFIDEAHSYKNLFLYTKMRNVAGLSTSDAQKSSDMLLKCRYMDEVTGGRGITFATGTPVSNSMTELYTMQRYLQQDLLRERNMSHFDNWASTFGETVTAIELAPEGTGYRARTRFSRFTNLPEMMAMFKETADIKTADQLKLPVPEVEYHVEKAHPTEIQQELVQELSHRAAAVHTGRVDPRRDNMLKITSDGRKLGLDQRIINPNFPDEPGSKVNMCVENIVRIWQEGQADKLTQLLFCDISTPKASAAAQKDKTARAAGDKTAGGTELHALGNLLSDVTPDAPFSVYDDIRDKLIAAGIPPSQIAFIHEANTDTKKKELFAKVRSGQVRVLMGSTFKMGAGMNVQDRLIAIHDLDCPWRPGDLEQRKGRIVRQGNQNPKVHVYRYVTDGTFDSYLWQTVENKQKFISQIMTSKSPVRSCEDVDETALSYAEIKALCAGNPLIKEKMDLDIEVARLKLLKADHQSQQYRMEDNLLKKFPKQIKENEEYIAGFEADMKTLAEHPHPIVVKQAAPKEAEQAEAPAAVPDTPDEPETSIGFAGMTVKGDTLTDRTNAGAALIAACKDIKGIEPVEIGSYRGLTMSLELHGFGQEYRLTLRGKMSYTVDLGKDPRGNLTRIENALAQIPERITAVKAQLENLAAQTQAAKAELGKPFPKEEELQQKSARLAMLNAQLNIDGPGSGEQSIAKSSRPSVLDKLTRPVPPPKVKAEKPKRRQQER